jgi:hypothetical protein
MKAVRSSMGRSTSATSNTKPDWKAEATHVDTETPRTATGAGATTKAATGATATAKASSSASTSGGGTRSARVCLPDVGIGDVR